MITVAALALLCSGAPVTTTPAVDSLPGVVPPRFANVVQIAGATAFLDAGLDQGLAIEAIVVLSRAGRVVDACRVTAISDHHAACATARARPGDRARLAEPPAPPPAKAPPPRTPREVIDRLREAVLLAEVPRVPFAGPRAPSARLPDRVAASGGVTAWAASAGGGTALERVDVSGRGAIAPGFEGAIRLAVERWSDASDRRFRPGESWQLYVWQARITETLAGAALSVGRFLPGGTIGQPMIDGAQASCQVGQGTTIGVYAGAVPAGVSTGPSLRYPTAALQLASGGGWGRALDLEGSARVGVVGAPSGARADAEISARASTSRADASASVQGSTGGGSGPALQAARVDVSGRPWEALVASAGYREFRGSSLDVPAARAISAATRRGDAEVRWTILPGLWAGAEAAAQRDLESGLDRVEFGPVVGMTDVLGTGAGFRAAWRQERGWFAASGADLAWWWRISRRLRVAGALSISRWARDPISRDVDVWASASVTAALAPWASLRASLSGNGGAFAAPAAPYQSVGGGAVGSLAVEIRR